MQPQLKEQLSGFFKTQLKILAAWKSGTDISAHQKALIARGRKLSSALQRNDFEGLSDTLNHYLDRLTTKISPDIAKLMLAFGKRLAPFAEGTPYNEEAAEKLLQVLRAKAWAKPLNARDCLFLEHILDDDLTRLAGTPEPEPEPEPEPDNAEPTADETTPVKAPVSAHYQVLVNKCITAAEAYGDQGQTAMADIFALGSELHAQEQPVMSVQLAQQLDALVKNPSEAILTPLFELMADKSWPEPIKTRDLDFIKALFIDELSSQEDTAITEVKDDTEEAVAAENDVQSQEVQTTEPDSTLENTADSLAVEDSPQESASFNEVAEESHDTAESLSVTDETESVATTNDIPSSIENTPNTLEPQNSDEEPAESSAAISSTSESAHTPAASFDTVEQGVSNDLTEDNELSLDFVQISEERYDEFATGERIDIADLFALSVELLSQDAPDELISNLGSALDSLYDDPSHENINTVISLISSQEWPEPIDAVDLEHLTTSLQEITTESDVESGAEATETTIETDSVPQPPVDLPTASPIVTTEDQTRDEPSKEVKATADTPASNSDGTETAFSWVEHCQRISGAANTERISLSSEIASHLSELEFFGLSDLFALCSELFREPYTSLSDQLAEALETLADTPQLSATSRDAVVELLGHSDWNDPIEEEDLEYLISLIGEEDYLSLCSTVGEQSLPETSDEPASHDPMGDKDADIVKAASTLQASDEAVVDEADVLKDDAVDEPLAEDSPSGEAELAEVKATEATEATTIETEIAAKTSKQAFCEIDPSLLEGDGLIVDPSILDMLTQTLEALAPLWEDTEQPFQMVAHTTSEALSPIIRALQTLNMQGAITLANGLINNIHEASKDENLGNPLIRVGLTNAYLSLSKLIAAPGEPSVRESAISAFTDKKLPIYADADETQYIRQLLAKVALQTADDIECEKATPDSVDLSFQADADAQLIDMLHMELPQLVEDFSRAFSKVTIDHQLEELSSCQRAAHTIKGLANMAGIRGLANLTHSVEDIFDVLLDEKQLPSAPLKESLLEASDCLAVMTESVVENEPAPDDAQHVLQRIYDWVYKIRTEGLSACGEAPAPRPVEETQPTAASETATDSPAQQELSALTTERQEENFVRVPESLLNSLFRIAGESSTLIAQQDERLKHLRELNRSSRDSQRAMQQIIFEMEQHLNEYFTLNPTLDPDAESFDPLEMDNYNEMHTSISRLHEAAADVREAEQQLDSTARQLSDLHVSQVGLQKENLSHVMNTRLVAVRSIGTRLQRILRQALRTTGKQGQLTLTGEETMIDNQILAQLTDPLMHIIRNAVDHGVEPPEERVAAHKPEAGQLDVSFARLEDNIVVTCQDDGIGIDTQRVRQTAIDKGLINEEDELSDYETQQLILSPGFSTRTQVSQLSGRGIGMDVVYQHITRMQGTLEINSVRGSGTTIKLILPSSSVMIHALLIETGDQVVAVSSHGISHNVLSIDGYVQETPNGKTMTIDEKTYPLFALEELMNRRSPNYDELRVYPVLIIDIGQGEQVAVRVREVSAYRELLFKDMGRYVPDIPGIPGLTVLATGQSAPVVDLPARIRHRLTAQTGLLDLTDLEDTPDLPKLLVVDDSVSARKSLASLLQDSAYDVYTAIDGIDALNLIGKQKPDLILTDLEMPRMSGIELAAAVRARPDTNDIPVIMITSRSTDKHRLEATNAGVSSYIIKPWTENNLLTQVEELLETAREKKLAAAID